MNEEKSQPIEEFIREIFLQNYEIMRFELGRALTPDLLAEAYKHIELYWEKCNDIAESVTDTEVRLTLPQVESPSEREFSIEGVVDIVREEDRTVMYDIKTHDADQVRGNLEQYIEQLNIYAHVWQELREQSLDQSALICTAPSPLISEALEYGNEMQLKKALEEWDPIVEVEFDPALVEKTKDRFGEVVDLIEEREFQAPSYAELNEKVMGSSQPFAVLVCRKCDARYSCPSYRKYAQGSKGRKEKDFNLIFGRIDEQLANEEWRTENLEETPTVEALGEG